MGHEPLLLGAEAVVVALMLMLSVMLNAGGCCLL